MVTITKRGRECNIGRHLHDAASIFTAELSAIKVALQSLKAYSGITAAIYTDSRSAVQAIQNTSKCALVREILGLLVVLSRSQVKVILCWIPGHAGIEGNELADKKAKSAIDKPTLSTQEIPVSDVKAYIKRKVLESWKHDWHYTPIEEVKLKEVCPVISGTPIDLGLSRQETIKLTRLRIGHTRFTHKYHFNGENEPHLCVECSNEVGGDVELSVRHVLLDCENFALERQVHYDTWGVSLRDLLTSKDSVLKVFQFLKDISWYKEI